MTLLGQLCDPVAPLVLILRIHMKLVNYPVSCSKFKTLLFPSQFNC